MKNFIDGLDGAVDGKLAKSYPSFNDFCRDLISRGYSEYGEPITLLRDFIMKKAELAKKAGVIATSTSIMGLVVYFTHKTEITNFINKLREMFSWLNIGGGGISIIIRR